MSKEIDNDRVYALADAISDKKREISDLEADIEGLEDEIQSKESELFEILKDSNLERLIVSSPLGGLDYLVCVGKESIYTRMASQLDRPKN